MSTTFNRGEGFEVINIMSKNHLRKLFIMDEDIGRKCGSNKGRI